VGDSAFFAGLARYVAAHRFREAGPDAVVDALATESGGRASEVRRLAQRWIHGRHGDEDLGPSDPVAVMRSMMPPELAGAFEDPAVGPLLQQMLGSLLRGRRGTRGEPALELPAELGELLGTGGLDDSELERGAPRGLPETARPRERRPTPRRAP
jgi:hypothetical protein